MYIQFTVKNAQGFQGFSRFAESVPRIGDKIQMGKQIWRVTNVTWKENDSNVRDRYSKQESVYLAGEFLSPFVELKDDQTSLQPWEE